MSNSTTPASTSSSPSPSSSPTTSLSTSTSTTSTTSTTRTTTSLAPTTSSTSSTSTVSSVSTRQATTHYGTTTTVVTVDGTPTTSSVVTSSAPPITNTASSTGSGGGGGGAASSSSAAAISNNGHNGGSGGLSTGATTAIAVIIPVAVVALLVGLGIVFWRKRKQKKEAEDLRRKEMEEYNYNPHGDPTLPAIGSDAGGMAMTEDHGSGYRGWGATTASNRKLSTTLSGGHTQQLSDSGHSYGQPSSPNGLGAFSDGHSSDPIVVDHNNDELGALGVTSAAAGGAGMGAAAGRNGLRRGPSNASSAYSAGNQSEGSEEPPPMPGAPIGQAYDYNPGNGYGYGQHGPYGDGTYGGAQPNGMPVVQDLNARRNTRIQPGGSYQQGNSGIAQNF